MQTCCFTTSLVRYSLAHCNFPPATSEVKAWRPCELVWLRRIANLRGKFVRQKRTNARSLLLSKEISVAAVAEGFLSWRRNWGEPTRLKRNKTRAARCRRVRMCVFILHKNLISREEQQEGKGGWPGVTRNSTRGQFMQLGERGGAVSGPSDTIKSKLIRLQAAGATHYSFSIFI